MAVIIFYRGYSSTVLKNNLGVFLLISMLKLLLSNILKKGITLIVSPLATESLLYKIILILP